MKDVLNSGDIAERLGVGVRHVQRLARAGRIPHVRSGRFIRVTAAAWEKYISGQTAASLASLREGGDHAEAA